MKIVFGPPYQSVILTQLGGAAANGGWQKNKPKGLCIISNRRTRRLILHVFEAFLPGLSTAFAQKLWILIIYLPITSGRAVVTGYRPPGSPRGISFHQSWNRRTVHVIRCFGRNPKACFSRMGMPIPSKGLPGVKILIHRLGLQYCASGVCNSGMARNRV